MATARMALTSSICSSSSPVRWKKHPPIIIITFTSKLLVVLSFMLIINHAQLCHSRQVNESVYLTMPKSSPSPSSSPSSSSPSPSSPSSFATAATSPPAISSPPMPPSPLRFNWSVDLSSGESINGTLALEESNKQVNLLANVSEENKRLPFDAINESQVASESTSDGNKMTRTISKIDHKHVERSSGADSSLFPGAIMTTSRRLSSGFSVSSDINDRNKSTGQDNRIDRKSDMYPSELRSGEEETAAVAAADSMVPPSSQSIELTSVSPVYPLTSQQQSTTQDEGVNVITTATVSDSSPSSPPPPAGPKEVGKPLRCYTCNLPGFPKCDDPFQLENGKLDACPTNEDATGRRFLCAKFKGKIESLPNETESLTLSLSIPKIIPVTEDKSDKWTSNVTEDVTFRKGDNFVGRSCFAVFNGWVWRKEPYNLTFSHGDITITGSIYICRNPRCNSSPGLVNENGFNFALTTSVIIVISMQMKLLLYSH